MEQLVHLHLVFRTSLNKPYTLVIDHPRVMLPAHLIRRTMQTLIDLELFDGESGKLVDIIGAYYTEVRRRGVTIQIL